MIYDEIASTCVCPDGGIDLSFAELQRNMKVSSNIDLVGGQNETSTIDDLVIHPIVSDGDKQRDRHLEDGHRRTTHIARPISSAVTCDQNPKICNDFEDCVENDWSYSCECSANHVRDEEDGSCVWPNH